MRPGPGGAALAATLLLAVAAQAQGVPAGGAATPVGLWRTFSDATGKETGRVQIFAENGRLFGVIAAIVDPAKRQAICIKCTDDRHDRPVLGLQIIRGLQPDGARWDGGTILDPETGSVYGCSLRLTNGGSRLVVRGFLGISLLGRSQVWVRAS